ncbi:MAG: anthranilate phosphoribosyltransferase [Bacteroidales bacterium]|jgi:anthranilate phosphoribosyltransferase|nr:anthranilate phosphoribosyltransferase [Bacteroidales bacterium]
MKEILSYLFDYKTLTKDDAKEVLTNIASGSYNDSEIAAFVSVYLMRNITVEELSGFRDALLNLCIPLDLSDFNTIDVCGTGGDGKSTFNISTLTSFVVAGAGEKVSKHGNYSVSSSCGSSNVMEYYGYKFSNDSDRLKREIDQTGICFLHAPLFNPAMKNVAPVRRSLRMKTFFNMLGPMVNPSSPGNQLIGVFSLDVARLYNYIYQDSGVKFTIIHSLDGYDEISLTGPFKAYNVESERIITPQEIGLNRVGPDDIYGGETVEEASKIFMDVLEGKGSQGQNDAVIANAAFALQTLDCSLPIESAIGRARESISSGKALNVFKKLIELQ